MRTLVLLCSTLLVAALTLGCHESGTSGTGPAPAPVAKVQTPLGPASAPADEAGDQTPADHEATAALRAHHRHHHHGGLAMFVALSLDTLGTDDAKRPQIEKLQADLHERMKPAREAERNLNKELADEIAAGTFDQAKLDAAMVKVSTASEAVHAATGDALNKLHALLTPEERAQLVEKVRAHWAVWRQVNHEAKPGGREKSGRLAQLTTDLALTPEQADKIAAALKTAMADIHRNFDHDAAKKHIEAFETAFASGKFDAKALSTTAGANGTFAGHGSKRTVLFYKTVTPLLTPEQRAKLADQLRERHGQKATPSK